MATSEAQKRASMKWNAKALKRVPFDIRKEYFENILKPAADSLDMGVNTFIKLAIIEKIEREGLDLPTDVYKP